MDYKIKAHPTLFRNTLFRSRLEARWAAFFELAGWEWEYEPTDLEGWSPDFWVRFYCGWGDCPTHHQLHVEVKPYRSIDQFESHACWKFMNTYISPYVAVFGINSDVTLWSMCHGDGGGDYSVAVWVRNHKSLWRQAGNMTQWKGLANQSS